MKKDVNLHFLPVIVFSLVTGFFFVGATCNTQVNEKARKDSTIHLELAQNYLKGGDLVSARREALLSIKRNPENTEAQYTIAYVFGQLKDWDNAVKHARLAIKYSKHYPEAENLLGVILMNSGLVDESIEVLKKLTEDFLYPTPHLAYGNLGLAYHRKGEHENAIKALKKAVQLQPLFCVGYYRMGEVYDDMKRYKDALESLKTCISIEDQWGDCQRFQDAYNLMGDIRMKLKTPEPAMKDYEKCHEINPNNATGIKCKKKMGEIGLIMDEESDKGSGEDL